MLESQKVVENQETPIYIMMIVALVSVLFWVILFIFTPLQVKFAVDKKFLSTHNLPSNQKTLVCDCNFEDNFSMDGFEDQLKKEAEASKSQEPIIVSILIFMMINFFVFMYFSETLINKTITIPLLCIFLFDIVCSYILYRWIFHPFSTSIQDDQQAFKIVQILPFLVISFHIFRKLFKLFMVEEPKLVGREAMFTDFVNWLFTMLVFGSAVTAGMLIPWPL